ncbi:MAG TPA: polyprenol monophosphomannose synthase [Chloroflexi bacterium]|nr:polyprenol monophosphomannose synthase [Chloroflexota bacterium]HCU99457.1 polyprenol monophosphomannose synthase [Chloroflexota bacterium]|tara:strand:- start:1398 stop:2135 length:738 start_codon:yes stop_codon:yes gene_type:complete
MIICTVLPTYNEQDNITALVESLFELQIGPDIIIVIDDNSTDMTATIVRQLAIKHNSRHQHKLLLVQRKSEKGLTSAIQTGIDIATNRYKADIITWMDCDLSMPPKYLPDLINKLINGSADISIGSRWITGGKDIAHGLMARTMSQIINKLAQTFLEPKIHDYTSGFVAAKTKVLNSVRLQGDYGEYCINLLCMAHHHDYKIEEIPYICVPRTQGESKTGITIYDYLTKGTKYVSTIYNLFLSNK